MFLPLPPRSLRLIRYLCVWQINSSLVRLPTNSLSVELAGVLGNLIAERLPTRKAVPWRKALAAVQKSGQSKSQTGMNHRGLSPTLPEMLWPLEVVLMVYPGKQTYGRGEVLLWELKLFGEAANHELFLELILPAMEEASYTVDQRWQRHNGLWGHFDIRAVYVAHGSRWEPLVQEGRLDLRYHPTPWQWAERYADQVFETTPVRGHLVYRHVTWLTPFDLTLPVYSNTALEDLPIMQETQASTPNCLAHLLAALIMRLNYLLGSASSDPLAIPEGLDEAQRSALAMALLYGADTYIFYQTLSPVPQHIPGQWIGSQKFAPLSTRFLPYLDLAAILHIGHYTQFGCGTFLLK
jgi:hypothetical protein